MRVLILGGTNFIGPWVVRRLVGQGHEVAVFHRGRAEVDLPPGVGTIVGDRRDLGGSADAFRRFAPEVVVDMIAYTGADADGLVAAFRGLARRVVVISSADVYRAFGRFRGQEGGGPESTPLGEDAPGRSALFPYRDQASGPGDFFHDYDKIPVERAVLACPDLPATVLRLPMVHGPGDPYRRVGAYLRRFDDGRPAIALDARLARWTCPRGDVENVAAAIALAATDDRAAGRTYNVADDLPAAEADWARALGAAAGWRGEVVVVPAGSVDLPGRFEQGLATDPGRIRRELGFAEVVGPDASLARAIAWERAQPAGEVPAGLGLLGYDAEDALLRELGHPAVSRSSPRRP